MSFPDWLRRTRRTRSTLLRWRRSLHLVFPVQLVRGTAGRLTSSVSIFHCRRDGLEFTTLLTLFDGKGLLWNDGQRSYNSTPIIYLDTTDTYTHKGVPPGPIVSFLARGMSLHSYDDLTTTFHPWKLCETKQSWFSRKYVSECSTNTIF